MKVCSNCGELKALDLFHNDRYTSDGKTTQCRDCRVSKAAAWNRRNRLRYNENMKRWREANPDKCAAQQRSSHLLRSYGMTVEQYETMLASQGGGCAVCGAGNGMRNLHIDHDHSCCQGVGSCGKCVRGLLCGKCNAALGMADDDPTRLRALADYLEGQK